MNTSSPRRGFIHPNRLEAIASRLEAILHPKVAPPISDLHRNRSDPQNPDKWAKRSIPVKTFFASSASLSSRGKGFCPTNTALACTRK